MPLVPTNFRIFPYFYSITALELHMRASGVFAIKSKFSKFFEITDVFKGFGMQRLTTNFRICPFFASGAALASNLKASKCWVLTHGRRVSHGGTDLGVAAIFSNCLGLDLWPFGARCRTITAVRRGPCKPTAGAGAPHRSAAFVARSTVRDQVMQ